MGPPRILVYAIGVLAFAAALVQASGVTSAGIPASPPADPDDRVYDGFPRAASLVGWISIACWLVVYSPQLWLCVVQQSGEGLSLIFLCIWLAGDFTNLLGAFWQGLLPTMIILAVYYTFCDLILIFQVFYYRRKRVLYPALFAPAPSESDPLLSSFSATPSLSHGAPPRSKTQKHLLDALSYLLALVGIFFIGALAWHLSKDAPRGRKIEVWDTKAQVVGWISAFLYLGSRIPQIVKNRETKCQGLSLLMFAFAVAGNGTYVASILLQSMSAQHILINASWLLGSGGTILLDFIVLGQFWWYASARKAEGKVFLDDEAINALAADEEDTL